MQSCEQLLVKGFQARNEELHGLALQSFEQALKVEPEDDAIRLEVARSQFDTGMFSEGKITLDAVPCKNIDDGEFLLDIGRVWMIAGEMERSLSCYSMVTPEQDEFPHNVPVPMRHFFSVMVESLTQSFRPRGGGMRNGGSEMMRTNPSTQPVV